MSKQIFFFLLAMASACGAFAASNPPDSSIVEVTGVIVTGQGDDIVPVPFATITVQKTGRGTFANFSGMFSIVVREGETLTITAVGFKTVEYHVPDYIIGTRHLISIPMEEDMYTLPTAVIFPWPSRENLRVEFLAMEPSEALALEDIAEKNLAENEMLRIAENMMPDGNEGGEYYLRQTSRNLYTFGGGTPPMLVFSPLAWAQFIKSLKEKKKKKED